MATTTCTTDDVFTGHVNATWPDGKTYDGEWKDGKKHGKGVYTWPTGDKYDGEWKDGKKHGKGAQTWPDGHLESGKWKDGVMLTPRKKQEAKKQEVLSWCSLVSAKNHHQKVLLGLKRKIAALEKQEPLQKRTRFNR